MASGPVTHLRLNTVAARRGVVWVRDGFRALGRYPTAFALLFILFYLAFAVLSVLPIVGLFLALALLPLRSLGFMLATRLSLRQTLPTPRVFVEPLRGDRARVGALLQLGGLYALAVIAVFWLGNQVDGGALEAFWQAAWSPDATPELLESRWAEPSLQSGLLFRLALFGLLALPFWHAPALAHWGGQPAVRALFFSCLACWRNRGAFAVYGLTWIVLGAALGLAGGLLALLVDAPAVVNVAVMAASLVTMTAFFASLWFTFADSFAEAEPATAAAAEPSNDPLENP